MNGRTEKALKVEKQVLERLLNYPQVVTDFYYNMKNNGKSFTTARAYIDYVTHFILFVTDKTINENFYATIDAVDIENYMDAIKTKEGDDGEIVEVGDKIRAVRWSALNLFFAFLKENGYINENPVEKTKRPRAKVEHQVTCLTTEEIAKMLENVKIESKLMFENRDLAIFSLAITTGLPVSAICNINVCDINFNENTISVIGKGHKRRKIPFGENLKDVLQAWLDDRAMYFQQLDTDALFISQWKQRISTDMVRKMLKRYTNGVTSKNITPHNLRVTYVSNIVEKTNNIALAADLADVEEESVLRYLRTTDNDRQKVVSMLDDMLSGSCQSTDILEDRHLEDDLAFDIEDLLHDPDCEDLDLL